MHRATVVTMVALTLSFSATTGSATAAEDVTFSKDVAPIIFDNSPWVSHRLWR